MFRCCINLIIIKSLVIYFDKPYSLSKLIFSPSACSTHWKMFQYNNIMKDVISSHHERPTKKEKKSLKGLEPMTSWTSGRWSFYWTTCTGIKRLWRVTLHNYIEVHNFDMCDNWYRLLGLSMPGAHCTKKEKSTPPWMMI